MQRIGKTLARAAMALAVMVTVVAGLIAPSPAQASPNGKADCNTAGWLCFWVDANFQGKMGHFSGHNTRWDMFPQSDCQANRSWEDCATSIYNRGVNCEAVVYEARNYGGSNFVINRGTFAENLVSWPKPSGGNWNDKISSNRWWGPSPLCDIH